MKPIFRQSDKKAAFTIVELLTIMSIIVILISLLVPAMNEVRRYATKVNQKNQFHAIGIALELFNAEEDGYPPSSENPDYCGTMKLCEAIMGQDLMGFHPASRFRGDFRDASGNLLYDYDPTNTSDDPSADNLAARKGPYLTPETAKVYRLWNLYGNITTEPGPGTGSAFLPYNRDVFVLCDVYKRVANNRTGKRVGMPILYYRAETSNTLHVYSGTDNSVNMYNYDDNRALLNLGAPWESTIVHPLFDKPEKFYEATRNEDIPIPRPYRPDTYILISAGFDGLYGTGDDVFNFER